MKKLILLLFLISCKSKNRSVYEVQYSADRTDSVAYVWYHDGKDYHLFYMAYPQFKVLYDQGGYEAAYKYYSEHELPEHFRKVYDKYRVKYPYHK